MLLLQQDYLYLLDNVRFKALRFAKLNPTTPFDDLRVQSKKIAGAVDITEDWKTMCTDELGIPASEMESIEPSTAEIGYASFLNGQTIVDDWFSLYIITIPCIYVRGAPLSLACYFFFSLSFWMFPLRTLTGTPPPGLESNCKTARRGSTD